MRIVSVFALIVLIVAGQGCLKGSKSPRTSLPAASYGVSATTYVNVGLEWRGPDPVIDPRYHFAGEPIPRTYPSSFEAPGIPRDRMLTLTNTGYAVGYDDVITRNPAWVAYRLSAFHNTTTYPRPKRFRLDGRTNALVSPDDYTRSGYDRGRMAPSYAIGACYGRDAQLETFLMSNICPQKPALNRKVWRRLEARVLKYARECEEVWVITGPVIWIPRDWLDENVDPAWDGDPHLTDECDKEYRCVCDTWRRFDTSELSSMPVLPGTKVFVNMGYYKIILDEVEGKPRMLAWLIPQDVKGDEPLESFLTCVSALERVAGFDFFPAMDDAVEKKLESEWPKVMW